MFRFVCTVCVYVCVCDRVVFVREVVLVCLFVCVYVSVLALQVYNGNPVPPQVGSGKSIYVSVE